jgi:hypothetical protein
VLNEIDTLSGEQLDCFPRRWTLICERSQAVMVMTKIGPHFSIFTKCADGIKPDRPCHRLVGDPRSQVA